MAIRQFIEPDLNLFFDDLNQAAILSNKATFVGRNYINILFSNMDNQSAPVLLAGSEFACVNLLFKTDSDTAITGTLADNAINFVYFNSTNNSLFYSTAKPVYDIKGGWYNGNNRALLKFFYTGGQYNNKIILDGYDAINQIKTQQPVPTTGGLLVAEGNINSEKTVTLLPGIYRIELKGGTGGNGGCKIEDPDSGGAGAQGEIITRTIVVSSAAIDVILSAGGDGNDGSPGNTNGGDGGGSSGGASYAIISAKWIYAMGGAGGGGNGSGGWSSGGDWGGPGGGGGQGYGTGGNGKRGPADSSTMGGMPGAGGSILKGGDGGQNDRSGGGVKGGDGGSFPATDGEKGGSGSSSGIGNLGAPGGDGGKTEMDNKGLPIVPHPGNTHAGGGGGGGSRTRQGGAGGSGLKTTSSGYARIYQVG